ncbi:MAG: ClbS/DfsB family four-helix bundle protein [Pseudomonadota bacterium]
MAATSKKELLEVTMKEFEKLETLIATCDESIVTVKDEDDTSIKDVIAHRAHWIGLFLGWYKDGMAGKEVSFPAKGYKWNELKRYNADLRDKQADLSWKGALRSLRAQHKKLIKFIESKSNADLYGGPMAGARNDWRPGRWAEASGPSHYRSACKYIRARRKELT